MKKILIIDGNSLLFRAYYATSYGMMMKTKSGIPTNAIFAFANMFNKAIDMIKPTHCVVAFDKGKKTFRHDIFADYKAGRKETPEELVYQFQLIREYLKSYNIPYLELDNIEADDIVGTLSKKFSETKAIVLSSDRDLLQLIDCTTDVYLMKKGISEIVLMDNNSLMEELGISPEQITDLKGLMGDASDNIPGVKGVGEKTALKLLSQYNTVDNLYEHIDELKGKTKELLIQYKDDAIMSKTLATINTNVDMDYKLDDFAYNPSYNGVYDFYMQYEMKSLAQKVNIPKVIKDVVNYESVKYVEDSLFKDYTVLYFDANEFDYFNQELYGLVLKNRDTINYIEYDDMLKDQALIDYLASDKPKVVYDLKKLYHLFDKYELNVNGELFDLRLASFLYDSNIMSYDQLLSAFNIEKSCSEEDVFGNTIKPKMIEMQLLINHAIEKATIIDEIYHSIKDKIKEYDLEHLFYDIELPLTHVLYKMEKEGIRASMDTLNEISLKTFNILEELTINIHKHSSNDFNINSPKQLAVILFDELNLPANKKRSTSVEVLEKLIGVHPIVEEILSYRKYSKIYSTYAEGLKRYVGSDSRVHTIFNQCATVTGRLSSIEPNLQNISVRDIEAREIRKAFIASEGCTLLACDYSQVELRVLADMANEEGLIAAFTHDIDVHTKTASDIFNVPLDEVDSNLRRKAKAVNFGIVYGISDFGLANQVNTTVKEAKTFIDQYFNTYPSIKGYMNDIVAYCEEHGYVKTLLNRRRYIKEINEKNYMVKEFGKRAAMNSPIQGSAADLIKIAMVNIDRVLVEKKLKSKMILQVHDELIFDVVYDELEEMKLIVKKEMEEAMTLKVPLVAEVQTGKSWYDAK